MTESLQNAIDHLAQKKHVVSEEVMKAKQDRDHQKEMSNKDVGRQLSLMAEFNRSINMLMQIFDKSRFDEIVGLAARPERLFILNFCMGLLKGIGFALGLVMMLGLALYWLGPTFKTLFVTG